MNSIRSKLLVWLMLPLTLVAAAVAIETFLAARKISNDLHDKTLLAAMLAISENVVSSNGTILADATLNVLTENLGDKYFYHVVGPGNSFVTGYSGFPPLPAEISLEEGKPVFYDGVHLGNKVRVIALRQLMAGRELNGLTTITAWQRVTQRSKLTFDLFSRSLLRMALLVLSAGSIVWFAVAMGLKPLKNLRMAIDSRTPYDLTPIKRPMPFELSGIVESMNDLFARVARSKANRERFIGDAAHQLKNPIAALKVQAEASLDAKGKVAMRSGLKQIVETTNQTGRVVDQMLASARMNAVDGANLETFDLSEIIGNAARILAPSAIEKNQDISLEIKQEDIKITGHRILLQEAITNLIDNAIRHTDRGSTIAIFMGIDEENANIRVGVTDSGKTLSEEELLRLSQPFATGGGPRSGSGLGLSIAKEVAKSHGGYLKISPLDDNKGKTIFMILPIRTNTKYTIA